MVTQYFLEFQCCILHYHKKVIIDMFFLFCLARALDRPGSIGFAPPESGIFAFAPSSKVKSRLCLAMLYHTGCTIAAEFYVIRKNKFLTVFFKLRSLWMCPLLVFLALLFSPSVFFFCYDVCYKSRINIFFQVIPDAVIDLKWIFTATRKSLNFFDTHLDCWPINFWMTFLIFFGFSVILVGYGFW